MEFLEQLSEAIASVPKAFFSTGPKDPAVIEAAKQLLGLTLPPNYRAFAQTYGKLSFKGIGTCPELRRRVMGLPTLDRLNTGLPDMVFYNLLRRTKAGLPPHLIAFRDEDGIECHCMDTNGLLPSGEPEVIIWSLVEHTVDERTGISFPDYLHEEIEWALDEE